VIKQIHNWIVRLPKQIAFEMPARKGAKKQKAAEEDNLPSVEESSHPTENAADTMDTHKTPTKGKPSKKKKAAEGVETGNIAEHIEVAPEPVPSSSSKKAVRGKASSKKQKVVDEEETGAVEQPSVTPENVVEAEELSNITEHSEDVSESVPSSSSKKTVRGKPSSKKQKVVEEEDSGAVKQPSVIANVAETSESEATDNKTKVTAGRASKKQKIVKEEDHSQSGASGLMASTAESVEVKFNELCAGVSKLSVRFIFLFFFFR
jgi:hypothetical protein